MVGRTLARLLLFSCTLFAAESTMGQSDLSLQKSVDEAFPPAGVPVEFTVSIDNAGPEQADSVIVVDQLPSGLQIPDGMAAFTSQGVYEPATGTWDVGSVAPMQAATLVVPALADDGVTPACHINMARITGSSQPDPRGSKKTTSRLSRTGPHTSTACAGR